MGEACSTYGGRRGAYRKERDHLVNLGIDVRIILRVMSKQWDGEAWIEFIWIRIRTGSELL